MRIPQNGPVNGSSPLEPLEGPMPPRAARTRLGESDPAARTARAEAVGRVFRHKPAVLLYWPLHAVVSAGADGPARPAFDKPGDPFASFTNPAIAEDQEMAAPPGRLGAEAPGRLLRPWP